MAVPTLASASVLHRTLHSAGLRRTRRTHTHTHTTQHPHWPSHPLHPLPPPLHSHTGPRDTPLRRRTCSRFSAPATSRRSRCNAVNGPRPAIDVGSARLNAIDASPFVGPVSGWERSVLPRMSSRGEDPRRSECERGVGESVFDCRLIRMPLLIALPPQRTTADHPGLRQPS